MNEFQPGDILIRVTGEHGLHKLGQSYELESIAKSKSQEPDSLMFKEISNYTYSADKYELHPISRSPLWNALK